MPWQVDNTRYTSRRGGSLRKKNLLGKLLQGKNSVQILKMVGGADSTPSAQADPAHPLVHVQTGVPTKQNLPRQAQRGQYPQPKTLNGTRLSTPARVVKVDGHCIWPGCRPVPWAAINHVVQ